MDRFEAIPVRKSCRRYDMSRLSGRVLDEVHALASSLAPIDADANVAVHVVEDGEALQAVMPGVVGAYGKHRAPHYLLGTGPARPESYDNIGFALEPLVLSLTAVRLGTCWVGGNARGDTFRPVAQYPADHRPLVLVGFGAPAEEGGHVREAGTGKRKSLDELLLNPAGEWAEAIEAARLAPSAGNLQPWRFRCAPGRLDAYLSFRAPLQYKLFAEHLRLMNRIDIGIALAHVRIAYDERGIATRVVRARESASPEGEALTYIASVLTD